MAPQPFRPDHGWAWVILAAGFLSGIIFDGIIFSFGLFLSDLSNHFDKGLGQTAWIGSTISAVYAIVGPVASILATKFGCRIVTIAGSIVSCVGFIVCVFSPAIWVMVLTYGIMGGIGFGMMYQCAFVMVGYYFEKRRALATGITACGSGVGIFIFGQLGDVLLRTYGWKGSMWIMAGISLNGAVLGCLYRPIPIQNEDRNTTITKSKLISFKILKSPTFIIFGMSSFLCLIGFFVPFMYLPSFAQNMGISQYKSSLLISIIGTTNTAGRILCGWVSDKPWADPLKIYNGALIIGGTATVCCAWLTLYPLQAVYAAIFGLCVACYVSLCAILLVEFLGLENLSDAFGFLNLFRGMSTIIGAPIAGMLYDATGRFDLAFYVAGSSIAAAGLICLPLRLLSKCHGQSISKGISSEDDIEIHCFKNIDDLKAMEKNHQNKETGGLYKKVPINDDLTVQVDKEMIDKAGDCTS